MQFDTVERPTVKILKIRKYKMAAAAILKNRHISAAVQPYFKKFGTLVQFDPLTVPAVKKFKILKIQDGGGRHLEKSENSHISAAVWPILTKFGTMMQFDHVNRPEG